MCLSLVFLSFQNLLASFSHFLVGERAGHLKDQGPYGFDENT